MKCAERKREKINLFLVIRGDSKQSTVSEMGMILA